MMRERERHVPLEPVGDERRLVEVGPAPDRTDQLDAWRANAERTGLDPLVDVLAGRVGVRAAHEGGDVAPDGATALLRVVEPLVVVGERVEDQLRHGVDRGQARLRVFDVVDDIAAHGCMVAKRQRHVAVQDAPDVLVVRQVGPAAAEEDQLHHGSGALSQRHSHEKPVVLPWHLTSRTDADMTTRLASMLAALALTLVVAAPAPASPALATVAGGCFWCMEPPFEKLDGVLDVVSGYSGGDEPNPTYEQVASGATGHAEAVQIRYDPARISYATLLEVFWRQIDPTDAGGQFVDRGRQYRSAIFVRTDGERRAAEASRDALAASGRFSKPIVTEIVAFRSFHTAEDYHQDYHRKNPIRYRWYRRGSGRDRFLAETWKDAPPVPTHPRADRRRMDAPERRGASGSPDARAVADHTGRRHRTPLP
jgi:methionine-S-sulfoxide reductase